MTELQSSSAAAAVTTPPAIQTTSTTVASNKFCLNWNLPSRHYFAQATFTKKWYGLAVSRTFWIVKCFIALHHTVEGFMQAVSAGLGIDPAVGFSHNREMAKMAKAWNSAKIQAEVKTKVDDFAKAHGEPVSVMKCDWVSLMTRFGDQHGDKASSTVVLRELRRSSC